MIDAEVYTKLVLIVDGEKDEPFEFLLCNNSIIMCSNNAEKQQSPLETCSTRRLGCLLNQGHSDLPSRGIIVRGRQAGELITRRLAFERYEVINLRKTIRREEF